MKRRIYKIVILTGYLFTSTVFAQWSFLGLSDTKIESIISYGDNLYVATSAGVYRKSIYSNDTIWVSLGMTSKHVKALVVINDSTFIVGVKITGFNGDTISLLRTTNTGVIWNSCQNGFGDGESSNQVWALYKSDTNPEIIYATGSSLVIAKSNDGGLSWQKSYGDWHSGGMGTHFVKINESKNNIVWAGGEGGYFQPFILKSTTSGETWDINFLDVGGDNSCYSITYNHFDSNIVYIGMEGWVVKTTDGGKNWFMIFQPPNPPYFRGLALTKDSILYAAGALNTGEPQRLLFYKSFNAGSSWDTIVYVDRKIQGVNCILLLPQNEFTKLFLGTFNDGVYLYADQITNVDGNINNYSLYEFSLKQNFPNPFNPITTMSYALPQDGLVMLKIYDALGREVSTLVNEFKQTGRYNASFDASKLSSGVYIYKLVSGKYTATKKMMLVK
ncbi:MAG: T9SS type A sorting domain-containing protein [Bacteroidota bacterium]